MRIREKKKQSYDRFRYLLEYQIVKGQNQISEQDEEPSGDIFDELSNTLEGGEQKQPSQPEQPTEQVPSNTEKDINVADNTTFEDTATDILKIHSQKIDNLTQYINDSVNILKVLTQKTEEIANNVGEMGNKVGQLNQQVDNLTPPTPLESLNQMIKTTTGAQSIEDYWNEYFRKHGRPDTVNSSLYYGNQQFKQNEKGMSSGVYRTPEITDSQISDIIKNT